MNGSFKLLCDNQSAIKIANKPEFVNRTKHIALRYFFVKDEIDKGKVQLTYCPTGKMAADFLTKKLPRQKFQYCADLCGVVQLPIPTYSPRNRKRPHPSSQNRDSRPLSPRHKPKDHKRQAYTAAEKLKWVAQLDVAVWVRALARESGIHCKCLANWKRAADFLKEAHSASCRMHGRGRASWYRPMEIKVYERLLDWRRKGTVVSVGRLQDWSWGFMKILYPLVKWKGSQRWSGRFRRQWNLSVRMKTKVAQKTAAHVAEQCKKFWQFVCDKRWERGIETTWIINADQTPLWLEMPATTTVDQTGVRSVPIRSAGYQKERVTVMLACTADGMKLKPWVFFKRKTVLKGVFPP
ncbi:unnamed protein product, partial [Closterium sp. NIES-53]